MDEMDGIISKMNENSEVTAQGVLKSDSKIVPQRAQRRTAEGHRGNLILRGCLAKQIVRFSMFFMRIKKSYLSLFIPYIPSIPENMVFGLY